MAFLIKPETVVIPFIDLYSIVATVTEDEHCGVKRIADMLKTYNSRKAVYSFAHIGRETDEIYLFAAVLEHKKYPRC